MALPDARIGLPSVTSSSLLGEGEGRPMIASTTSGGGCRGGWRSRLEYVGMLAHGRCYGSRHGCPRRAAADAFSHFLAGFAFCTARGCDFCKQQFAHKSWCRQQPPGISPARLLPPGNDGRTGKLTPCTTGGLCRTLLAACKALAKAKQQLWTLRAANNRIRALGSARLLLRYRIKVLCRLPSRSTCARRTGVVAAAAA